MARPEAGERLRRLLALISWLADRGGATLTEIADRFEMPPNEIRRELEMAACCGLPPYSPDALIELLVENDEVSARIPDYFARPLRLTAADGLALLATGQAMLALPGGKQGPLAAALAKLEEVLGGASDVAIDLEQPPFLAEVQRATERRERLEIRYYAAWRDDVTERCIDPLAVFSSDGRWYVIAFDHERGEERKFRIDRIQALTHTGDTFEPRPVTPDFDADFTPGPSAEVVTLLLPSEARWVVETYPTRSVSDDADGRIRVELDVLGRPWLERLLLRVGAGAEVVEPPELRDVGREAAARLLERYS